MRPKKTDLLCVAVAFLTRHFMIEHLEADSIMSSYDSSFRVGGQLKWALVREDVS